jgi:hypothetical protein
MFDYITVFFLTRVDIWIKLLCNLLINIYNTTGNYLKITSSVVNWSNFEVHHYFGSVINHADITVERVQSETLVFRHPVTSDKYLWSQGLSVN